MNLGKKKFVAKKRHGVLFSCIWVLLEDHSPTRDPQRITVNVQRKVQVYVAETEVFLEFGFQLYERLSLFVAPIKNFVFTEQIRDWG